MLPLSTAHTRGAAVDACDRAGFPQHAQARRHIYALVCTPKHTVADVLEGCWEVDLHCVALLVDLRWKAVLVDSELNGASRAAIPVNLAFHPKPCMSLNRTSLSPYFAHIYSKRRSTLFWHCGVLA